MGGVVSSVGNLAGNIVGGVGGAVNNVVQRVPGIGPVLGPVAGMALGQTPLSAFGSSLTSQLFNSGGGGGGGSAGGTPGGTATPIYAQPNISYGTNTYQANNKPIDTSKYFITGDRGVYNLLPAFGAINAPLNNQFSIDNRLNDRRMMRQADRFFGANQYTPYEAYQDIRTQMANDPKALAAFNSMFNPTAYNVSVQDRRNQIASTTPSPLAAFNTANPFPQQYVDFGLRGTAVPGSEGYLPLSYNRLADYAYKNKNPFFLPFETTQGATAMGFTPSASLLAADTTNPYYTGLQTALTAQRAAEEAAENARRAARGKPPKFRGRDDDDDDDDRPRTPIVPPVTPNPVTPAPVTPTPVTPTPVTPAPVTPTAPGTFVPMRRGGIAALRRK